MEQQQCGAEVQKEMLEDVKIMVATSVEDKYVSDPSDKQDDYFTGQHHRGCDDEWEDSRLLKDIRTVVEESPGESKPDAKVENAGCIHPEEDLHEQTAAAATAAPAAADGVVLSVEKPASTEFGNSEKESRHQQEDPDSLEAEGDRRLSESSEPLPIPHSDLIPLSGPIHRSSYSGAVPYSGNLSLRSDSSTTSTRSFAFPVLTFEWNSSPAKMAPPDKRFMHSGRWWWRWMCCCFCCCSSSPATCH